MIEPTNLANHQQYWEARAATAVIPLAAGTHTITPFRRVSGASGKNAIINQRCMSVESVATDQSPSDPVIAKASCAFDTASTTAPNPAKAVPGRAVTVNDGAGEPCALVVVSANAGIDV